MRPTIPPLLKRVIPLVAILALAHTPLEAQRAVELGRRARPDGTVKISAPAGSIRIVGWERDSVAVTGTLGPRAESVDLKVEDGATRIAVLGDRSTAEGRLEIRVPRNSYVAARTGSAELVVSDVWEGVDLGSETGRIRVSGALRSVHVESAGGPVVIDAATKIVRVETVGGPVTVTRAAGFTDLSTVSGDIELAGRNLSQVRVTSVTGNVRFAGSLDDNALSVFFESHAGAVELALPANASGEFEVTSVKGGFVNEFGPSKPAFSLGRGGARVIIRSFKGTVTIRRLNP
jgi:hypothetical protein